MKGNRAAPPVVAIVGRPNVGKSTLFNRLVGRRLAITDSTPGVTRDPVTADGFVGSTPVRFFDTGGMTLEKGSIHELVTARSLDVASKAGCIVLMLDVTGVTPEDEEFIERLRPLEKRIVVAVNKVDNTEREQAVWDFYRLGFAPVVGISATHGGGVGELEEAVAARLAEYAGAGAESESADATVAETEQPQQDRPLRIAV
ncbi:GTPase, partial [Salinispira pacifica]